MTGIEQVLLFGVGVLAGAAIMQFREVQKAKDSLLLLAGQFDQLQDIMHGYVGDLRLAFEKQLAEMEDHYTGEMDDN